MDDSDVPIDVHCSKLLDWLISRRHCSRDWQKRVVDVREKIKLAILDMPEHEAIVKLLAGGYINCFHVRQIVEILKETEAGSKNFLGFYSSQRMKDWQAIDALYTKDSIGLAEASQLLQRTVAYELPGGRKAIAKADQGMQDGARKEKDYTKQAADAKKAYEKELSRMGLQGKMLRSELLALASELPEFLAKTTKDIALLRPAAEHYAAFRDYVHDSSAPAAVLLPALSLLFAAEKPEEVTVYQLRYGTVPSRVDRPAFDLLMKEDAKNDAGSTGGDDLDLDLDDGGIDLGDDDEGGGGIDFGEGEIDVIADDTGLVAEDGVARGDEALALLECPETLRQVGEEMEELASFLASRAADEEAETASDIFILGSEIRPEALRGVSQSSLKAWSSSIASIRGSLCDPAKQHLARIRTSPQYVETLVESLVTKREAEGRYIAMARLMEEKQIKDQQTLIDLRAQLTTVIKSTKVLRKQIETEISKKYNGRPVNIMGGINQALAPA